MPKPVRTILYFAIGAYLLTGGCQPPCAASSGPLSVTFDNHLISVRAHRVPLGVLLQTVADNAEITITSRTPLAKMVSCDLKAVSIEGFLRHLLKDTNYAVIYRPDADGTTIPQEVNIFGSQALVTLSSEETAADTVQSPPADSPADPIKRMVAVAFDKFVGDASLLSKQIAAVPVFIEERGAEGIRITNITAESIFDKIGVEPDDIIVDVNGTRISSTQEFIALLADPPQKELGTIRIDRIRANKLVEPIYVELK